MIHKSSLVTDGTITTKRGQQFTSPNSLATKLVHAIIVEILRPLFVAQNHGNGKNRLLIHYFQSDKLSPFED